MTDYTKDDTIDPDRMAQWSMASKLPYTLTTGVTATREGLRVTDWRIHEIVDDRAWPDNIIPWPTAAERLRYRDGEPWCRIVEEWANDFQNEPPVQYAIDWELPYLHRIAAILCDDADGFRILHWCIYNLTSEQALDELVKEAQERGEYD